jgi:hypothetical protein
MIDGLEQNFNKYGCVSRCLIKLAELKGRPITPKQFCEKFGILFTNPQQPGLLVTSQILNVIRDLSLAQNFIVSRRYEAILWEHNHENKDVLVFSETWNGVEESKHCCLLSCINATTFTLWNPVDDGGDMETLLRKCAWESFSCHGVVLLH